MREWKRKVKWTFAIVAAIILAIQLIPMDRTNPPVDTEVAAPPEVRAVLRRACYDCHSNETAWPWYSRIAPVSWQIAWDVREGREAVNFSRWDHLGEEDRRKAMHDSWEEVSEGEMPPWLYLSVHPDARLSDGDRALLQNWALSAGTPAAEDD